MNQTETQTQYQRSPDLIDVLPLTAKRVIDIGCGVGVIAKEFHNLAATTGGDPKTSRADASVFQYIVKAR